MSDRIKWVWELVDERRSALLTSEMWTGTMPGHSDAVISLQTKQHTNSQANNSVIAINNESDNSVCNYDSRNHNDVNRVPT